MGYAGSSVYLNTVGMINIVAYGDVVELPLLLVEFAFDIVDAPLLLAEVLINKFNKLHKVIVTFLLHYSSSGLLP